MQSHRIAGVLQCKGEHLFVPEVLCLCPSVAPKHRVPVRCRSRATDAEGPKTPGKPSIGKDSRYPHCWRGDVNSGTHLQVQTEMPMGTKMYLRKSPGDLLECHAETPGRAPVDAEERCWCWPGLPCLDTPVALHSYRQPRAHSGAAACSDW